MINMTRFKKCEMGDCDRTATKKIRLYLPIEEEHLGPVIHTHVRNEGFDMRQKSYALKREYETIHLQGLLRYYRH